MIYLQRDLDNNCINELPSKLIGKKYVSLENNNASYCYSCERLKEQICSSCNDDDFECAINSKGQIYHLKINNQDFSNGIPDIIFELTYIKELYLLNDKISSISEKTGNISNLKRLDIRGNNINTLPDNIGNLNKLKYLYLNNCKLNSIPKEIDNLTNLQKLIIPDEIGNLKNLNELMLDNNCLESIPNTIDTDKVSVSYEQNSISYCLSCTELKEITCKTCNSNDFICETNSKGYINSVTLKYQIYNNTNAFPSIITKITSLEKLDLRNNSLKELPRIENLINLQELILSQNSLSKVPSGIEQLNKLQRLDLSSNNINEFPEIEKLINLQELKLNNNGFSSVPSGIEQLIKLQILDLSNNRIKKFPEIGKLTNLQELKLNNNGFNNVPSGIEQLNKLQRLNLSRNNIGEFPEIEKLINLKELDLSNTGLTRLPYFREFIYIRILNLNKNYLMEFQEIEKFINLQELLLKDNAFKRIPSEIKQLDKLKLVDLRNNGISSIPPEFDNYNIINTSLGWSFIHRTPEGCFHHFSMISSNSTNHQLLRRGLQCHCYIKQEFVHLFFFSLMTFKYGLLV
ncbi:L domain-like protein [Anaeromyces robustus]|uniref:L domain-like protein n=1 Tax=Anaeromyces robustus TaxID=1754192 RepID=A0A1Y1WUW4_9FUNG|nr:L domain-like protein [Anaeromyces robustus]|eukprot:ORX77341.1 L domain-like protein [Anaeromyces robustus]